MANQRQQWSPLTLRRWCLETLIEEKMNRSEKHIKQSMGFAAAISAVAFIVFVARELVGFDKFNPGATPKTFPEVVANFPRLLGFTAVVFVGALW